MGDGCISPRAGRTPLPALVISPRPFWANQVKAILEASRQFFVPHTRACVRRSGSPDILRGLIVIDAMYARDEHFLPVREAKRAYPGCPILLVGFSGLTEAEEGELVDAGLVAGAQGYTRDYRPANPLVTAAVAVISGHTVIVLHRPNAAPESNPLRWPEHQVPHQALQAVG